MLHRMFLIACLPTIFLAISSAQAADWSVERYRTDKGVLSLPNSAKPSENFAIEQAADVTFRNFLLLKANQLTDQDWHLRPSPFRAPWVLQDQLGDYPQPVLIDGSPDSPVGSDALVVRFNFAKGSANLSDQDKRELAQFAQSLAPYLQQDGSFGLLVIGHTDSDPFRAENGMDNQRLSELRAAAVAAEIANQFKVGIGRLKSTGFADRRKIFVENKEDKKSSRRVEIQSFIIGATQ